MLTDTQVRGAKPSDRPQKLTDARGCTCWCRRAAAGTGGGPGGRSGRVDSQGRAAQVAVGLPTHKATSTNIRLG